jgi:LacI family transcriptional regulator
VPYDPELISSGHFDVSSALRATEELLALPTPPTAIFAINDMSAVGAMAAAHRRGLRVPDDVAVVGYNDSEVSSLLPIPLTTVRYPLTAMGERAVDLLMARLAGHRVDSVVMTPELVVRASTSARAVTA